MEGSAREDEKGGVLFGVDELVGRSGQPQAHASAAPAVAVDGCEQGAGSGMLQDKGACVAAIGAATMMLLDGCPAAHSSLQQQQLLPGDGSAKDEGERAPGLAHSDADGTSAGTAMDVEGKTASVERATLRPQADPPLTLAAEGGEIRGGREGGVSVAREQHPSDALPGKHGMVSDISRNAGAITAASPQMPLIGPPGRLTPCQLASLFISMADFEAAVKVVQPSAKREGFTTIPDVTWEDVGALGDVREELEFAISRPIQFPEQYAAMGLRAATGVLLYGPPGCGKTLVAKAIANDAGANFISIKVGRGLRGQGEQAVQRNDPVMCGLSLHSVGWILTVSLKDCLPASVCGDETLIMRVCSLNHIACRRSALHFTHGH